MLCQPCRSIGVACIIYERARARARASRRPVVAHHTCIRRARPTHSRASRARGSRRCVETGPCTPSRLSSAKLMRFCRTSFELVVRPEERDCGRGARAELIDDAVPHGSARSDPAAKVSYSSEGFEKDTQSMVRSGSLLPKGHDGVSCGGRRTECQAAGALRRLCSFFPRSRESAVCNIPSRGCYIIIEAFNRSSSTRSGNCAGSRSATTAAPWSTSCPFRTDSPTRKLSPTTCLYRRS